MLTILKGTFLIILVLVCVVQASIPADRVTQLPGLQDQLPFKMYSGYLKASGDKKLHYWFVESAHDLRDPLVLWMNGGPGCSSMEGLLEEHGPVLLNADGATLRPNKYSWNSRANVLYLEAPAGVGFSYSKLQNYSTNDDLVSLDNYLALKDFFLNYPEFRKNDFYITGESYAGIYVPTLSVRVLADKSMNFKGMVIGNGITDFQWNDNSLIYFGYYHGLISQDLWTQLQLTCCPASQRGPCDLVGNKHAVCQRNVLTVINIVRSPDINMYNLYAPCLNSGVSGQLSSGRYRHTDIPYLFMSNKNLQAERRLLIQSVGARNLKVEPPCVNSTAMETYLNRPDVRKALHIPTDVQKFEICSGVVSSHYRTIYKNTKQFYSIVMAAGKRVLIYNGDVDMACNFIGDEWFVGTLGIQKTAKRRQWFYQDPVTGTKQVAGYVDTYPLLTFTTIRGAGHMVPQDRPKVAYDMINKFLQSQDF